MENLITQEICSVLIENNWTLQLSNGCFLSNIKFYAYKLEERDNDNLYYHLDGMFTKVIYKKYKTGIGDVPISNLLGKRKLICSKYIINCCMVRCATHSYIKINSVNDVENRVFLILDIINLIKIKIKNNTSRFELMDI